MSNLLQYTKMVGKKKKLSHAELKERVRMLEEDIIKLKFEDAIQKQRLSKLEEVGRGD